LTVHAEIYLKSFRSNFPMDESNPENINSKMCVGNYCKPPNPFGLKGHIWKLVDIYIEIIKWIHITYFCM
jgi:hypothetical protein